MKTSRLALAFGVALAALRITAFALPPEPASNLPTGGRWASNPDGTAGGTIGTPSATQMQLNQNQRTGVIDFNCFCSRQGTLVNLTAPSSDSTTLVRSVEGANLWGRFTANDRVFISSSPGVYFAPSANIEVGSLFATSLSITNADFFAGRYQFSNAGGAGPVINQGTIITPGGYAALAAPQVRNEGVIVARLGSVALAAGDRVTLDMVGDGLVSVSVDQAALNALALNSGSIQADGGRVLLTARSANALLDTVINNTGVIRANSLVERSGEIVLDGGSAGVVASSGTLQADGGTIQLLGGVVNIDGGAGGGPVIPMPPGPISVAPGDLILGGSGGGAIVWSSLSLGTLASISQGISASVASPSGTAVKYPVGVTLGGGAVGKLPPLPLTVEGSGIALPPGVTLQR